MPQQNAGVNKLAAINTGLNAYQMKELSIPPVGISSKVNPIVSVRMMLFSTLGEFLYLRCKSVRIQVAMTRDITTPILKKRGACGGANRKKQEVNASEI